MKKIGIVISQNLGPTGHGAESHTVLSFCNIFNGSYRIVLIGGEIIPQELKKYHTKPFISYIRLPKILRFILHLPICLINTYKFCRKNEIDFLINGGGVWYAGFSILVVGKIFNVKYCIRTAEDHFRYWKYVQSHTLRVYHFCITNLLSAFILKRSKNILTVGKLSRDYFISYLNRNDSNTYYSVGPINRDRFNKNIDFDLRKSLNFHKNDHLVLYVGAISGVKGTHFLPEIISYVKSKCNQTKFIIIGNETEPGNRITSKIINSGGDSVKIIPPVQHDELQNYYKACDVLVFLCQVGVGYGQVNIEACLCNLPILSLNPGLDVEWFLKDACNDTPRQIASRIVKKDYKIFKLPREFNSKIIKDSHLKIVQKIIE